MRDGDGGVVRDGDGGVVRDGDGGVVTGDNSCILPDGGIDDNFHVTGDVGRGISVIFHNETTLNGEVICDRRCLGVSGMLGLEGNTRFTFAWFANDEDLERRFPKM